MDPLTHRFKLGDRVVVWANTVSTPHRACDVNVVQRHTSKVIAKEYQKIEVTFLAYAFSDECVLEPSEGLYHWIVDERIMDSLRGHPFNSDKDIEKLIGRRGCILRLMSILDLGQSSVDIIGPDGVYCDQCHEFAPMASANMPDNKFKCYQCREDRFRLSF